MHERRVFVDLTDGFAAERGGEVVISAEDSHHIRTVLRLSEGAAITAVCRITGQEYEAVISELQAQVKIKIVGRLRPQRSPSPVLTIAVALLKGDQNDLACDQLTQFGVKRIIFWQAQRSVARLKSADDQARKTERWKRICEASAKQSGQSHIPEVEFASGVGQLIQRFDALSTPGDNRFFCSLLPEAREIQSFPREQTRVHMVVGPEGDFSPAEEQIMLDHGIVPLNLGTCRFRSFWSG